ncbi:MAG: hypothetical protein M0042_14125 [Nitrospiraceae bacterium]|nr:hypothetical protein [Nitrospiraceae bacterium]
MKTAHDKGAGRGSRMVVWSFFVIGVLLLLAGALTRYSGVMASLPKAEIITGAWLVIGAIIALATAN